MATLLALYKKPADASAFDAYYFGIHVPLAKKLPELQSYEVSSGPVNALHGESPYHLVAALGFASVDALVEGLGRPEARAIAADLANFAHAGVDLLIYDTKMV